MCPVRNVTYVSGRSYGPLNRVQPLTGNLTTSSGPLTNSFRHTGREFDTETNLYYYRARYYDPATSKFISEDPIRFEGKQTNFYPYVRNSPANYVDPSGLRP
jgi:RHS repeat-associated protein